MRRIAVACAAALLALVPSFGQAVAVDAPEVDREQLERIETYLNDLDRLQARFVQIAPDGRMSRGTLYLDRPGRMRLDYDPPARIEIVAARSQVVYYDARLDQLSYIPLRRTPLAILLADEIRLDGDVTVLELAEEAGRFYLTVTQTESPEAGQVTLVFDEQPMGLRSWTVVDAQALTTHILLEDVETDVRFARDLFVFRSPRLDPGNRLSR